MNWLRAVVRAGVLGLLLTGTGVAQDKPVQQDSMLTIPGTLHEYYYGGLEPERLSYAMDLWYDAVLNAMII